MYIGTSLFECAYDVGAGEVKIHDVMCVWTGFKDLSMSAMTPRIDRVCKMRNISVLGRKFMTLGIEEIIECSNIISIRNFDPPQDALPTWMRVLSSHEEQAFPDVKSVIENHIPVVKFSFSPKTSSRAMFFNPFTGVGRIMAEEPEETVFSTNEVEVRTEGMYLNGFHEFVYIINRVGPDSWIDAEGRTYNGRGHCDVESSASKLNLRHELKVV